MKFHKQILKERKCLYVTNKKYIGHPTVELVMNYIGEIWTLTICLHERN